VDHSDGTIEIADSGTAGVEAKANELLTSPYNLDRIGSEVAPLAAYFRDNIDSTLVTYFEFSNETWNLDFIQAHWLNAQGVRLFGGDGTKVAGYLSAHCMKVIRDTYGPDGRKRWRGIIPTQTVSTDVTLRYIRGIRQYIDDHAPKLIINDLYDDLAVTGYWGGSFVDMYAPITRRWMNDSEARFGSRLESSKYSYFNRVANEDCADGRHTGMGLSLDKVIRKYWLPQKAIADAIGLGFVQYEGGNHNNLQSRAIREDPQYFEFYPYCNHTREDAANYAKMFEKLIEIGGRYPSKFVEAGQVNRYGAWGGLRHLKDKNPVWDVVVKFNERD
jgi:hypothetical protein